jgi:tetratricopeptide (TPR) repeat protein
MAEVFLTDAWCVSRPCRPSLSCADLAAACASFEENAEQECERYATAALQVAPDSFEALQLLASLRMSQQRPAEAAEALDRSLALWWRDEDPADQAASDDDDDDEPAAAAAAAAADDGAMDAEPAAPPPLPPYPFRVTTTKLLLELDRADRAADVAATLLVEDDEDVEVLYLAGLAAAMADDIDDAREHLDRATALLGRVECAPEMRAQVGQLLADVRRRLDSRAAAADGMAA